jgi:putative membrane protein
MIYDIFKIVHIVSVICWMAGIFYLPRLFVYHVEEANNYKATKLFEKMEDKLFKIIMMPAFICTYATGFYLGFHGHFLWDKWFLLKIFFVFLLTGYHFLLFFYKKRLIHDTYAYSGRFFRILNEIPIVILIIIITIVILKPFS